MELENIFGMKFFFGEMDSFHSFLSNKPLKIVEIFSITKKGELFLPMHLSNEFDN